MAGARQLSSHCSRRGRSSGHYEISTPPFCGAHGEALRVRVLAAGVGFRHPGHLFALSVGIRFLGKGGTVMFAVQVRRTFSLQGLP